MLTLRDIAQVVLVVPKVTEIKRDVFSNIIRAFQGSKERVNIQSPLKSHLWSNKTI